MGNGAFKRDVEAGLEPLKPLDWRIAELALSQHGGATHMTRHGFEHDRIRDQRLTLAGFQVVRFPWRQVFDDPRSVEATLRALLRRAA